MEFWNRTRIPTAEERSVIDSLERIINRWQLLKKSQYRRTPTTATNEAAFARELDDLFNIKHHAAESLIRIEEDRLFLLDQEGARKMTMGAVDMKQTQQEKRAQQRREQQSRQRDRAQFALQQQFAHVPSAQALDEASSDSSSENESVAKVGRFQAEGVAASNSKAAWSQTTVISSAVASALDRTNTSDRKAAFIVAATAQTLGHDVSELAISPSAIRAARIRTRTNAAAAVKQ